MPARSRTRDHLEPGWGRGQLRRARRARSSTSAADSSAPTESARVPTSIADRTDEAPDSGPPGPRVTGAGVPVSVLAAVGTDAAGLGAVGVAVASTGGGASPGSTSRPTGRAAAAWANPQSSRAAVGFHEPVVLPISTTSSVRPPRVAAPMNVCCAPVGAARLDADGAVVVGEQVVDRVDVEGGPDRARLRVGAAGEDRVGLDDGRPEGREFHRGPDGSGRGRRRSSAGRPRRGRSGRR